MNNGFEKNTSGLSQVRIPALLVSEAFFMLSNNVFVENI